MVIPGLNALLEWTKAIGDFKGKKDERTKLALTSLVLAVTETRHYLAAVRQDAPLRNLDKEMELSRLWQHAGTDMLPVNPDLANLYLMKADYWSDPVGWTEAQKDDRRIQLDAVYEEGRKVLLNL